MSLTAVQRRVREKCTAIYTATIEDENGAALAASSLTTLTLTLYDQASSAIINSRDAQDVLNAHNVVVSALGTLTWTMQPADNVIVGADIPIGGVEAHIALFQWTWSAGAKTGKYEIQIDVKQLEKVV